MKLRNTITLSVIGGVLAIPVLTLTVVAITRSIGCGIVYCNFEQEGVATIWAALIGLVGGLTALAGAIIVGLRQTEILHLQTSIQSRAVELEELKLKADLYDRRLAIFTATKAYAEQVVDHQRVPGFRDVGQAEGPEFEPEIANTFQTALGASEFLLSGTAHDQVMQIAALSLQLRFKQMEIKEEDNTEARKIAVMAAFDLQRNVANAAYKLSEAFADDLRMTNTQRKASVAVKTTKAATG